MDLFESLTTVWGAALLMVLSFVLIVVIRVKGERNIVFTVLIAIACLLHVLSMYSAFVDGLPGAEMDAMSFHLASSSIVAGGAWPSIAIGTTTYEYILAGTYRVLGANIIIGQSLSVLVAVVVLLLINSVSVLLGVVDHRMRACILLIAGLCPTFLFHHVLTFREPFQLLGLVIGVFFVLRSFYEFTWWRFLGAVLGFLVMGLFHQILLGVGVVLICTYVALLYAPKLQSKKDAFAAVGLILAVGVGGYGFIVTVPSTSGNDYISKIRKEGTLLEAVVRYRQSIEDRQPRTSYDESFRNRTGTDLAQAVVGNYWNYISKPYATDLEVAADWVPFVNSVLRVLLLGVTVWLVVSKGRFSRELCFCLIAYIAITAIWSLGTTNYGQAFRHHVMTDWLVVVMCGHVLFGVRYAHDGRRGDLKTVT